MRKPTLKTWRRLVQLFIAAAFIVIPIVNRSDYSYVYGNFLSFHLFGIPFADPLAVLQLAVKNFYLTFDNFVGALIPLLLAFFLGTVFCSWICVYGLLSEWTQALSKKILGKKYTGFKLAANGFPLKIIIFVAGFIAFLIFSTTPILNQLSMAAWYSRFFQYLFGQDIFSLCILFIFAFLALEFFARKRIWCRYICPQSVLIILAKQLDAKRLKVAFTEEKCICRPGYERCEMACTLQLKPKQVDRVLEFECSNCGDCTVACSKMGKALNFEFPLGHEVKESQWFKKLLPAVKKIGVGLAAMAILTGSVYLVLPYLQKIDFSAKEQPRTDNPLLKNKRISWAGSPAVFYEFLEDGTLVCVGGDWPLEGFKGWRWESVDNKGSFKVYQQATMPGSYFIARMKTPLSDSCQFSMEHYLNGNRVEEKEQVYTVNGYGELAGSHQESATVMDARVVLKRFAQEVYTLDLTVFDPGGKKIRKILTQGDLITTEGMLTAVHRWINSPVIIASEGKAPDLPIHTSMELRFHDGRVKKLNFKTTRSEDHTSEVFDDPWF